MDLTPFPFAGLEKHGCDRRLSSFENVWIHWMGIFVYKSIWLVGAIADIWRNNALENSM